MPSVDQLLEWAGSYLDKANADGADGNLLFALSNMLDAMKQLANRNDPLSVEKAEQ